MTYRRRFAYSAATMCIGIVAAVLFINWNGFVTRDTPADVRGRLCRPENLPRFSGAVAIAGQNSKAFAGIALGAVTLGLRTVSQLLRIGFDAALAYGRAAIATRSHAFAIAGVAPHAFLELPAFLAAGATSIGFLAVLWRLIVHRERPERQHLMKLGVELVPAYLVLLLAALVEEYVTTYALRWVVGC